MIPKHMHHERARALPWDSFKGAQVGRKEVSLRKVCRPGREKPVAGSAEEENMSAASAYGSFAGVGRASAKATSRKMFGAHAQAEEEFDPWARTSDQVGGHTGVSRGTTLRASPMVERVTQGGLNDMSMG